MNPGRKRLKLRQLMGRKSCLSDLMVEEKLKEAMFYDKLKDKTVKCFLCHRDCVIVEGKKGFCRVRKNIDGKLYSLVYGKTVSMEVDPVEKKPLYHFMPGSSCLSISTLGCNFACLHCQNYFQSQADPEKVEVPFTNPEEIIDEAVSSGCQGISYTYNEPTIFFEYALDVMRLAKKNGLYNAWVTNGYMSKQVIDELKGLCNASNIDLKGDNAFYEKVVGNAKAGFVKENIMLHHEKGIHVEVTNLIIPGWNDKQNQIKGIIDFIVSVDKEMPLHFTRFFPVYKMQDVPPTELSTLNKAYEMAKKAGLKHVYVGNIGNGFNDTYCPNCNSQLIERIFYSTYLTGLSPGSTCKNCGIKTNIILEI